MMQDMTHVFKNRVSFWIVIGKSPPLTFIKKATQLQISLLTMDILSDLCSTFSLLFLAMS
ncbi:hypothetical protein LINGRAHAP2_LOCUS17750 [Linum grandiflorum]